MLPGYTIGALVPAEGVAPSLNGLRPFVLLLHNAGMVDVPGVAPGLEACEAPVLLLDDTSMVLRRGIAPLFPRCKRGVVLLDQRSVATAGLAPTSPGPKPGILATRRRR